MDKVDSCGMLNCIMSDGRTLFCYASSHERKGLKLCGGKAPFRSIRLKDPDWDINLNDPELDFDLAKEKEVSQRGFIVASQPLSDEERLSFKPGELKAFRDGGTVFSSKGKIGDNQNPRSRDGKTIQDPQGRRLRRLPPKRQGG